jgi:hypothetical protein
MQAYIVAIAAPQTAEGNCRYDGQYPESDESFMDPLNHFGRIGACAGKEKRCGQARRRYAEANRDLLHCACDGTCTAGVLFLDVSECERIHARVLQRCECSIKESLQHDGPNRCSHTDRCKHPQKNKEN